jgi:23S rRNA pseudouridine2604 synthase
MAAPMPKDGFPMRINKYLAHKGYATRVGADELISKNRVFINGRVAVLGDKVLETDEVEVKTGGKPATYIYAAYNKPRGVITHSPAEGEADIKKKVRAIPQLAGTFPVGRLDKDSSGLIILTNDGRITDRLLNPDYDHTKEYVVTTKQPLRDSFKENMEGGMVIEGEQTRPAKVQKLGANKFSIILTEGKKHQIRRMVVALFNEVQDLRRTKVMNVELGSLPEGAWRPIEGAELKEFLSSLGL